MDGHHGKPTLFLTTGHEFFLGNQFPEELALCGSELCGFNVGVFEQKLVTGVEHNNNNLNLFAAL